MIGTGFAKSDKKSLSDKKVHKETLPRHKLDCLDTFYIKSKLVSKLAHMAKFVLYNVGMSDDGFFSKTACYF